MKPREKILVLILAGGAGGRLGVLTERRAKPAMPYGGTLRLIDFALSNCLHSGLSDVWVIEQYQLHTLNDHLANGRPWDLDRTYGGLQVLPPSEEHGDGDAKGEVGAAHGNADAIYQHRKLIGEFAPDLLVVLSADHIYKLDYRDVIDRHRACGAEVTVVTTKAPAGDDPSRFGVVQTDDRGLITGFQYKPKHPRGDVVTAEVFVYNAPRLFATLDELMAEDGKLKDYGDALLPRFVERGNAWEFRLETYWRDVGTLESYWQSHMDLIARQAELALDDPKWPILTYTAQRLPARIETGAEIADSLIAPGCTVAGTVRRSVLGPGVTVAAGAVIEDSVVLRETQVEAGARIRRAIVDEEVIIGAGAEVGGGTDLAVVGTALHLPANSRVQPGECLSPPDDTVPTQGGKP